MSAGILPYEEAQMNRPARLRACPRCGRHHRVDEARCPFCGRTTGSPIARASTTVMAGLSAFVLMACYGAPPSDTLDTMDTNTPTDVDGDGFFSDVDCDDADFDVNPDATEDCGDGVDNDCDGNTDTADPTCP